MTTNFPSVNTDKIYSFGYGTDEENYLIAKENVEFTLEEKGWYKIDEPTGKAGNQFMEREYLIELGGETFTVYIQAIIHYGYYDGYCFDIDGYIDNGYSEYDLFGDYPVDEETIKEDVWFGLESLTEKYAHELAVRIQKAVKALKKEAEDAFKNAAEYQLRRVGCFQNGETVYELV